MRFMFQYPDFHGPDGDMLHAGGVGELAAAAEQAGWHGIAFTEHPAPGSRWLANGGHQTLDPFVALAGAATVTTRLRLLTFLTVFPYRSPLLLAKTAASVDKLSNGRLILGAGAGYLKGEFAALGVDFDERNALFEEALDVLPLHWSGKPFSYDGRHWKAKDIQGLPRPAQDPIPIWIGGNSKAALRRVAERCQGWMPLVGPEEMFATTRTPSPGSQNEIAERIRETKEAASGRDVELDFALAYLDNTIAKPRIDVERHREALGRLAEIGVTWVVMTCPSASAERTREFLQAVGEAYIQP